jgi:hypothetical protein
MNDRIIEMAIEAGFNPVNCTGGNVPLFNKFAELIVRECMEVCADRGKHHYGLYSAWASDCSERIGKRFGVKE